ncbi:MAG: hypothetical protein ASARMPRED_008230 [Alectoria sarmentosa]|nr:MAG: hypothetical protein ASARMPRED_008230 [Alectoria sarmentosa]
MEVAGIVFAALGFVNQAINTGTFLSKLSRDVPEVGMRIVSATTRLEAQQYTLQLWHKKWAYRAESLRQSTTGAVDQEELYKTIWGGQGYAMIIQCLAQSSVKLGEAQRTLSLIDPDSIASTRQTGPASDPKSPSSPVADRTLPVTSLDQEPATTERQGKASSRLFSSSATLKKKAQAPDADTSRLPWYRRRRSVNKSSQTSRSASHTEPKSPRAVVSAAEERNRLTAEALQLRLGPGTKIKWSITLKEDIRSLLREIDEWLNKLQSLADQCEEQRDLVDIQLYSNPLTVRATARALYIALPNALFRQTSSRIDFKLERKRANTDYFNHIFGPIPYVDSTNHSFKFPLFAFSRESNRFFLVVETIDPKLAPPSPPTIPKLEQRASMIDLLAHFSGMEDTESPSSIALSSQDRTNSIIIHSVPNVNTRPQPPAQDLVQCTFYQVLEAQSKTNPLIAGWRRLQLACTIAVSVLHLYQTGWMPEHLESSAFYFFGPPQNQLHETSAASPFISPSEEDVSPKEKTPFDCLRRPASLHYLFSAREEQVAALLHQLGIVLFELGRGGQYRTIFSSRDKLTPSPCQSLSQVSVSVESQWQKSTVLEEIEKIEFGRSYRELVTLCLTGSLYCNIAVDVESHFNGAIVQK